MTRDYDGSSAEINLINILRTKTIEARNAHCLVMHKLGKMGFTSLLTKKFSTVCFTETPLTQIKKIATRIPGRRIQLKPFGLIFWKDPLFESGASPAIYINAKGTLIDKFILDEFDGIFTTRVQQ